MMKNSYLNIVAVSFGVYPSNNASNIRHLTILKGLSVNGATVKLLSIYSHGKNISKVDKYDNVSIEHVTRCRHVNVIERIVLIAVGILFVMFKLINYRRRKQLDIVILYPTKVIFLLPLMLICKLIGARVIHERTEFPFLDYSNGLINRFKKFVYLEWIIPSFDGLFVISKSLVEYFNEYFKKDILLIPIVVEPSRFEKLLAPVYSFPYFAYCGSLTFSKDGLDILIDSFAEIADEFPNIQLLLIGNLDNSGDKFSLLKLISESNLSERVVFTGEVSYLGIPRLLYHSEALLLSRPDNIQAKYGLPTKLGEYLITGKPVIVTAVGDIPLYLSDEINAFIAKPGSKASFIDKMRKVLINRDEAISVGENGKSVCIRQFDYSYQAKALLEYFRLLCHNS